MQLPLTFKTKELRLPKRYEILEREAKTTGAELTQIVRKIENASSHIKALLGKIQMGGVGQFQLFLGKSGLGKTTFLRTLPNFFKNIEIVSFDAQYSFDRMLNEVEQRAHIQKEKIFIIDERDNPEIDENALRQFFEKIRVLFRKPAGAILLIWPITDENAAAKIGEIAWGVGSTSLCPTDGAIYHFKGLPKEEFYTVADETVRNLNNGESLESFGISEQLSDKIAVNYDTLGDYYAGLEALAYELNENAWKILEEKRMPKVWILLAGDSATEVERTVKALTQGIENRIDVDRMLGYLDDTTNVSAYLNDWRAKRNAAGFLFRFLDVRLFDMSPNLALSAVRVHGSTTAKADIKKKSEAKNICYDSVKRAGFYLSLTGTRDSNRKSQKTTNAETQYEFIRLQKSSKSQDKELNKALAQAIGQALEDDGYNDCLILSEKQALQGTSLKPDIQIEMNLKDTVCLEITWRSTGIEVPDEVEPRQNTLSPGHIQKYVLEKTMEYIKELGL